jgi:hypothetical protein
MGFFKRTSSTGRAPSPRAAGKPQALISADGRAALERIGREEYGPPYPGSRPRVVTPSGADYYLHATEVLGTFPVPDGGPKWTAYEDRMCAELIAAVEAAGGGWAWAGALVVAGDMSPRSRNPHYLDLIDRSLAFLHESGVPSAFIPGFALDRWFETNGSVRFGATN